jgi:hypothetical protein
MSEEIIKKYVKNPEGLKKEIESFNQRYPDFSVDPASEEDIIYHETVIFLFSIIYKYLVFENIPLFSGGKGLDALIEYKDDMMNVEFEVLSSEFRDHTDEQKQECKMVVCWRDNSRKKDDCWKYIDVIELRYFWKKYSKE